MIRSAYSFLLKARSALFALGARCSEKVKSPSMSLESRLNRWSGKLKKFMEFLKAYGNGFVGYLVESKKNQRLHNSFCYAQTLHKNSRPNEPQTQSLKSFRCRSFTKSALNWVSSLTSSKRLQAITKTWNSLRSAYTALSKTMRGRLSSA